MIDITKFVENNEIITTDKYLKFASENENFVYHFRDFLFRKGYKRESYIERLVTHTRKSRGKTLIVGHSDWTLRRIQSLPLLMSGITRIFGTNVEPLGNSLAPIPLGITNNCNDSDVHPILGNEKHFISANDAEPVANFDGSIYINFTASTFPKERNQVLRVIDDYPKVTIKKVKMTNEGRVQYLRDLRTHSLIPCPRGNGIDTHRLWETLYMGGTPVLKRNPLTNELTRDLPVIYINDWKELLNLSHMEKEWNLLRERMWSYDSLGMSYWISKMKDQGE